MSRSLTPRAECGAEEYWTAYHKDGPEKKIMDAEGICFDCAYWRVKLAQPSFDASEMEPLFARPAPAIPAGWRLVPVEIDPKMLRAAQLKSELGAHACAPLGGAYDLITELYSVLIAASPEAAR